MQAGFADGLPIKQGAVGGPTIPQKVFVTDTGDFRVRLRDGGIVERNGIARRAPKRGSSLPQNVLDRRSAG